MHMLELDDGYAASCNGDFSGNILFRTPGDTGYTISLPFSVLEAVVAEKVRADRIAALEEAEPRELLS